MSKEETRFGDQYSPAIHSPLQRLSRPYAVDLRTFQLYKCGPVRRAKRQHLPSLHQAVQRRAAHAHGRDRSVDHIGLLIRMSRYKSKRTGHQFNGDIAWFGIIEDRPIQFQRGTRPERKIGVITGTNLASLSAAVCTTSSRMTSSPTDILSARGSICETMLRTVAVTPIFSVAADALSAKPAIPVLNASANKMRYMILRPIFCSQCRGNSDRHSVCKLPGIQLCPDRPMQLFLVCLAGSYNGFRAPVAQSYLDRLFGSPPFRLRPQLTTSIRKLGVISHIRCSRLSIQSDAASVRCRTCEPIDAFLTPPREY